jgi:hypothetical protein
VTAASSAPPVANLKPRRPARRDRVTHLLANLFFFCALLPFLSPLPARSDVQLPAFVVAAVIVLRDTLKGRFTVNWVEGVFIAVGIWSFCFVLPGNPFTPRERIGILSAFLAYWVVKKHAPLFSPRVLMVAIVITLGSSLVQLGLPSLYGAVAPFFLRTVKDLSEGGRGASGPSAEPSFLAGMALVHGLLIIYYFAAGRVEKRTFQIGVAMAAASLLISKSATGFMYLGILAMIGAGYYAFRGMTVGRWVALLVSIAVLFGVVLGPLAESRGGVILVGLYQKPDEVLADGSAQERVRCLTIGVLSMIKYPLGVGGGGFPDVALEIYKEYKLQRVFERAREVSITGILNAGGMYFAELGLVFVFFLAIVLGASMRIEALHLLYATLAFFFMMLSFSITFPLTWVLLGLAARKDFLAARPATIRHAA